MKHPQALKNLIFVEMAETYAYFTLQAILVFYLINALGFSDASAYAFSGQFVAIAYLMPIFGGWIGDRLLGNRKSLLLGGLLLCLGYASIPLGRGMLCIGLALVVLGNGLFRPSIASLLAELYTQNESRREAGFTLVYVGVNVGSLLGIASVGYIQKFISFGACFGAASCAALLSVCIFRYGISNFKKTVLSPSRTFHKFHLSHPLSKKNTGKEEENSVKKSPTSYRKIEFSFFRDKTILSLCFIILLSIIYYSMQSTRFGNCILLLSLLTFCILMVYIAIALDKYSRQRLVALLILFLIATLYKAMFFETYFVVNVFTERLVNCTLFGYNIPATVFLSLGSFFSIMLGPFFVWLWRSKILQLSVPFKFALSLLIIGICMQMLATMLTYATDGMLSTLSIILFRFLFVISEFLILPIGLSAVAEYAPKQHIGLMMGAWFYTAAIGGKIAGILANFANVPKELTTNLPQLKLIYQHAFEQYALLNFGLFAICLLLIPFIKQLLNSGTYNNETQNQPA